MSSLVLSHLMNGIMDCVQVQSLGSLGQIELAGGSAVLVSFILSGFAGISKVNFYVLNNLINALHWKKSHFFYFHFLPQRPHIKF